MGVTQTRKDRERAAREELILDHAQRMLAKDGFQTLNLDSLATAIEYSKGTIYLHFETKEDLALGVATRLLKLRADLFERASGFQGRTRERARAIGVASALFAKDHQEFFKVELMLKSPSFWERTSSERRRLHSVQASRTFHSINSIVSEAIRVGDLPAGLESPKIALSLIAINLGSFLAATEPDLQVLAGISSPGVEIQRFYDALCDGWGWKPLLGEWDYSATNERIARELFSDLSRASPGR